MNKPRTNRTVSVDMIGSWVVDSSGALLIQLIFLQKIGRTVALRALHPSLDIQLRLMMNTVLSSMRSCSPTCRRTSSFFTA